MDYTIWQIIIALLALAMVLLSAICVVYPQKLIDTMPYLVNSKLAKYSDLTIRILLGISLILSAKTAIYPLVFTVFGYISLVAVLAIMCLSTERLASIIKTMTDVLPVWAVRLVCTFSMLFFGLLICNIG